MAKVETVRVVNKETKTGYMTINKEDFTNKRHTLFDDKKTAAGAKAEMAEAEGGSSEKKKTEEKAAKAAEKAAAEAKDGK